jgi:hypothetical protein
MPAEFDDHFLSLRSDANFDLYFVHGVSVTTTREGQAAAALADILMRGVSQTRIRRFATLLSAEPGPFHALPSGWTQVLPPDAPLTTSDAWNRLLVRLTAADWPDGENHAETLCRIIALLAKGPEAASEIGESLLKGRALAIWRKSLLTGPAASLDMTIESLKQSDGPDPCVSIAWMSWSMNSKIPTRFK